MARVTLSFRLVKCTVIFVAVFFLLTVLLYGKLQRDDTNTLDSKNPQSVEIEQPPVEYGDNLSWGPHKLALIIPFRDRLEELLEFAPHIHKYLKKKKIRHTIYVINQGDNLR